MSASGPHVSIKIRNSYLYKLSSYIIFLSYFLKLKSVAPAALLVHDQKLIIYIEKIYASLIIWMSTWVP